MELTNEFRVALPVERAWAVLTDVERIAPCMPGAQLQEIEGDEYRGIVKIKVGPITAQYKGQATFLEQDEARHVAVLRAEGRETRGQGNANATITATLAPDGDGTAVSVVTDLTVTGRVAQFGRGVLADVSAKLLDQFVDCLEKTVLADDLAPAASSDAARSSDPVPSSEPAPASKSATDGTGTKDAAAGADTKDAAAGTAPVDAGAEEAAAAPESPAAPEAPAAKRAATKRPATKRAAPLRAAGSGAATAGTDDHPAAAEPADAATPVSKAPEDARTSVPKDQERPEAATPATAPSAARPTAAAPSGVRRVDHPPAQPVDLISTAGTPVAKRVGPVLAVIAVLWLLKRLFGRRRK